jgi:outer membrane receptor protein involved in Fe transport
MKLKSILLIFLCCFVILAWANETQGSEKPKLYQLSLAELAKIQVYTGSLTETSPRKIPGALTTITQEMIEKSGARRLDELLEIYVPNLQMLRQTFQLPPIGMRGILKDDDASILYMVNGRILNRRSLQGAQQERDLPMMGDIHHIEILRGPNSAVYGPGGVTGIVNVVTFDGDSFEGQDVKVRFGVVEDFKSAEARASFKWGEDARLFVTGGVSEYIGADASDSPYFFSSSFALPNGLNATAGEAFDFRVPNDHASDRDQLKKKFHLQFDKGGFEFWARYTKGGSKLTTNRLSLEPPPNGPASASSLADEGKLVFVGYQQISSSASYNYELNNDWNFDFSLSYDLLDFEQGDTETNNREDEYNAKVLAHWSPNDTHKLVFGTEYSHEIFGLKGLRDTGDPTRTERQGVLAQPWSTNTYSFFAEHQWSIAPEWTSFLDMRVDKHSFTDFLFSPRASLIYAPNEMDTWKFIVSRAVRRSPDDEIRAQWLASRTFADNETIINGEVRYERQQSENLNFAVSGFVYSLDLVAFEAATNIRTEGLGKQNAWGIEVEGSYVTDKTRFNFSHGYTKLISFDLDDPTDLQTISAQPNGFGSDLATWSNHITKLAVIHDFDKRWSGSASLRLYWGFPGGEDASRFFNGTTGGAVPRNDEGFTEAFDANVYLNLGLQYKPVPDFTFRLDAYNTLGWIDIKLNKRNFIPNVSEYRAEAAALAFTAKYEF